MSSTILSATSLLTPEQAAGILGVTAGTLNVWRATRRYPLPYVKVGRKVMYRAQDLEAFAASRMVSPVTDVQ
jgi:excisionase family DNA binding protein